jgi:hypothetical protein
MIILPTVENFLDISGILLGKELDVLAKRLFSANGNRNNKY